MPTPTTQVGNPYGVGYYPETNPGVQTAAAAPGMMQPLDTVDVTGGISDTGTGQFGSGTYDFGSFTDPTLQNIGVTTPTVGSAETGAIDAGSSGGGFDWSSVLNGLGSVASSVGNFLTSPLGSSAALIGLGQYEAGQAQKDTQNLTSQLTGPAQGFVQGGVNEQALAQKGLTGTPVTDGSIGQQEQAAAAAGQVATQDMQAVASGQLPKAYEDKIQQDMQAQQQQIRAQLASQGITDGSVLAMYDQQIQNNAEEQRQSILNNLQSQGAQAQQMVQQTYTNLLNDSIAQFTAGMGPIQDAVNLTVQQNTQIANGLQSLFGQIARGFMGASQPGGGTGTGGAGGTGAGTGGSPLGQIGNQLGKALNSSSTDTSGITNDINASIGADYSSLGSELDASTAASEASVTSDVSQSNMDWLSGLGGPSGAGGQAAAAGGAADALTPSALGDYSFAPSLSGVGVGSTDVLPSVSSAVDAGAADAGSAAGGAGSSAAGGAASAGGSVAGTALGAAGAGLSIYNEVNSWQSGATGQDALSGAESGAAVGATVGSVVPVIGTAVGAAVGAIGGAIAGGISSLFGSGKVDPENASFENYTQAYNKATPSQQPQVAAAVKNPYVALAGYFDLRSGQMKGQNPIYSTYGRMGEQKFTNDLISKVDQAKASGQTDPTQIWTSTVQPWINSMGTWQDSNKNAMTALIQNMTAQIAAGTYKTNFKAIGGDNPW